MSRTTTVRIVALLLAAALTAAPAAYAQQGLQAEAWRTLAMRLDPGTAVKLRLMNGQRFDATLIAAEADAVLIQPRTRRPVPVQRVSFGAIASLERREAKGMGAARAALIGVGAGTAAGFAVLMLLIAALSD